MSAIFRRDYLVRLPLPLAQLYSPAYNAKDARSRDDNCFYLFGICFAGCSGEEVAPSGPTLRA